MMLKFEKLVEKCKTLQRLMNKIFSAGASGLIDVTSRILAFLT